MGREAVTSESQARQEMFVHCGGISPRHWLQEMRAGLKSGEKSRLASTCQQAHLGSHCHVLTSHFGPDTSRMSGSQYLGFAVFHFMVKELIIALPGHLRRKSSA